MDDREVVVNSLCMQLEGCFGGHAECEKWCSIVGGRILSNL